MSEINVGKLVEEYGCGYLVALKYSCVKYFCFDDGTKCYAVGSDEVYTSHKQGGFGEVFTNEEYYRYIDAEGDEYTKPYYYDENYLLQMSVREGIDYQTLINKAAQANEVVSFYPSGTIQLFSLDNDSEIEWDNMQENIDIINEYLDALLVVKRIEQTGKG